MKNRNILILITLFFCFCLSTSYSNDHDERTLLTKEEELSYDVGDEDSVRDWETKLKPYIEESVNKNERMYFKNPWEVQYAQQFNYISGKTGKILYKPKVNEVAEINEVETVEKVDYSETDEILYKPRKKGCCCM